MPSAPNLHGPDHRELLPDGREINRLYAFQELALDYFHPDWQADTPTYSAAIREFKAASTDGAVAQVADEINDLLALLLSDETLRKYVLGRYSLNFDPATVGLPMAVWLADVADELRRPSLDEALVRLGNLMRRFLTVPADRNHRHVHQIETILLTDLRGDVLNSDLGTAVALHEPRGAGSLVGTEGLLRVFAGALESVAARTGRIGLSYFELIHGFVAGGLDARAFQLAFWPIRRRHFDAGRWFEGQLGNDVESFAADVDAFDGPGQHAINEMQLRSRAASVGEHILRVLTPRAA